MKGVILLIGFLLTYTSPIQGDTFSNSLVDNPQEFSTKFKQYVLENTNVSQNCINEVLQYTNDLIEFKMWALKMFDASAKMPSGILDGNLIDLGSFDECINVNEGTIYGKYCLAEATFGNFAYTVKLPDINVTGSNQLSFSPNLQLAICFPAACTASDLTDFLATNRFNVRVNDDTCQTKLDETGLDIGAVVTLYFFGFVLGVIIVSTIYDATIQRVHKAPAHPLLISFSILTNGKKLLASNKGVNEISCLNGIRVISTMWIILGHTYLIRTVLPVKNRIFIVDWITTRFSMFIMSALISVDTFLLISGLTLSYVFMAHFKEGVKFNLLYYYLHRYVRLTPALSVMILFHLFLGKYMGSGPLWPTAIQNMLVGACERSWWRTLLYIQNYFGKLDMCVIQSWYLSVDTQLFILSPLLLLPLRRWPKVTLPVTGFLTLCSMASCFAETCIYDLGVSIIGPHNVFQYMMYYYTATHTRASPWLIGIILGYLIHVTNRKSSQNFFSIGYVITFWIVSLIILTLCVFTGFDLIFQEEHILEKAFYNTFQRPAWSVAVGWVIYACQFGYGGFINLFLSCRMFRVLSRFTYSLYLTHIFIIYITTLNMRTASVLSNSILLQDVWVQYIMSLFASILLTLAFESPVISIEKVLLKR